MIFVDGVDIGDVADVALRDRRMLSADGIFIIVATVSEQDGSSVVPPEVLARGVPFLDGQRAPSSTSCARRSRTRSTAPPRSAITEIDVLESHPPRRPGGVHLRPAQAPADGAAGRRRGLSGARPRRGSARAPTHRDADPGACERERGARGASRDDQAAEEEADARHGGAERLQQPGTRACRSSGVASCSAVTTATHWMPLPAPPSDRRTGTRSRACRRWTCPM